MTMSEVFTYDYHQFDGGPSGEWWEVTIDGTFAGTMQDIESVLTTIKSVIRDGHIVHIHTVAEYYADLEKGK